MSQQNEPKKKKQLLAVTLSESTLKTHNGNIVDKIIIEYSV